MLICKPIDIDSKQWADVLGDSSVTTQADMEILQLVYESNNHEMRASEIAARLGLSHHAIVNIRVVNFSKRVVDKMGIQPPKNEDGLAQWWHVPFCAYKKGTAYPWIMRPALVTAFEEVFVRDNAESYPDELADDETVGLPEGAVRQVFVNRYERNARARRLCVSRYGSTCAVCGFDFEKVYGPMGKDKIHVHHLVPLSAIREEYSVDPERDLRPVCPNCHVMIHSRREPFTIEELQAMINAQRGSHDQ